MFGFKPTYAVGTDILHGAVFKTFGVVRHRRLGTVHARLTVWMFLGSGPMSLLGVALAGWLEGSSPISQTRVSDTFSPVCRCASKAASIEFSLRKADHLRIAVRTDSGGVTVDQGAFAPGYVRFSRPEFAKVLF